MHWNSNRESLGPRDRGPASPGLDERLDKVQFFDQGVLADASERGGGGSPLPRSAHRHAAESPRPPMNTGGGMHEHAYGHAYMEGDAGECGGPGAVSAGVRAQHGVGAQPRYAWGDGSESAARRGADSARGNAGRLCRTGSEAGVYGRQSVRSVGIQDEDPAARGYRGRVEGGGAERSLVDQDTQTAESCMLAPPDEHMRNRTVAERLEQTHGVDCRGGVLPKPVWQQPGRDVPGYRRW